jgi:hypothetical protein
MRPNALCQSEKTELMVPPDWANSRMAHSTLVGLFDADLLSGEDLAEVDLLSVEASCGL